MLVGEKVRWVRPEAFNAQVASRLDEMKIITQGAWSVTLISHMGTNFPFTPKSFFGHAYILVEHLDDFGNRQTTDLHISMFENDGRTKLPDGEAKPLFLRNGDINLDWPRTDTFLRPAYLVQAMIDDFLRQIREDEAAVTAGHSHIIRFDAINPRPEEGIHNCLSHSLQMMRIADIVIPMIRFPFSGGTPRYVPRFHIRPLDELCKILAKDDTIDIEPYVTASQLEEIATDREEINKINASARNLGLSIGLFVIIPGAQVALPLVIPIFGAHAAYLKVKASRLQDVLEIKKARYLERYFKGDH